jgi:hypothetical protein
MRGISLKCHWNFTALTLLQRNLWDNELMIYHNSALTLVSLHIMYWISLIVLVGLCTIKTNWTIFILDIPFCYL